METDDKRFLHGSADYTGGEVNTTLFLVPVNHAVTSYIPGVSGVGGGSYSLANPLIPEPGRDRRVRKILWTFTFGNETGSHPLLRTLAVVGARWGEPQPYSAACRATPATDVEAIKKGHISRNTCTFRFSVDVLLRFHDVTTRCGNAPELIRGGTDGRRAAQ
ncbi:unnamed protein product [Arctogadus glacialis]